MTENQRKVQAAVKRALEFYASTLGVSFEEAVELYKAEESTQQCIHLLVIAQADPEKLRLMAAASLA
jgi:hypothetical protein